MKTLLLNVSYSNGVGVNGKGSYWMESYVKNLKVSMLENESIHDTVKRVLSDIDCVELSYNGKPQANMYRDIKNEAIIVGYIYRVKSEVYEDRKEYKTLFDAWVEINEVKKIELESVES